MEIVSINDKSSHLEKVKQLADNNTDTLGFFPGGAFSKYAEREQILVALDRKDNLLGYLLYGINQKEQFVYIVHLCVEKAHRKNGIARALFNKLKTVTKNSYIGIRVRCRRDYDANKIWPKLGFVFKGTMSGRSKFDTKLSIWWFDHNHPTLFTVAEKQRSRSVLQIPIDANILYDLQNPNRSGSRESRALLADWLQENIDLCVTSEIFNEIQRQHDGEKRRQSLAFANKFTELRCDDEDFQEIKKELSQFFPRGMTPRDESDLRHLARSIAANAQFFITRDENLLEKSKILYEKFDIDILCPSDLIIHQDRLLREAEYQPSRLAGSHVQIERLDEKTQVSLQELFGASQDEKKVRFQETDKDHVS